LRVGSIVYVTTNRIIANKGKAQYDWKTQVIIAALVVIAPAVPAFVALAILVGIAITIVVLLLRRHSSGRGWPTLSEVEKGQRRFEVKKGAILSIELRKPGRLRSGSVAITPLMDQRIKLKIVGGKNFAIGRNLLVAFEPTRTKLLE